MGAGLKLSELIPVKYSEQHLCHCEQLVRAVYCCGEKSLYNQAGVQLALCYSE